MDTNTIIILISTQLLTTVTIILAVINQSNNLNKKIDEVRDRLSKLESKLDISDVNYKNSNQIINTHSEDIKELKTDIKNIYTNKFNIVKDTPEQVPIF